MGIRPMSINLRLARSRYDPGGTSVNSMIHWQQEVQSGSFRPTTGSDENMIFYNQSTAPEYD